MSENCSGDSLCRLLELQRMTLVDPPYPFWSSVRLIKPSPFWCSDRLIKSVGEPGHLPSPVVFLLAFQRCHIGLLKLLGPPYNTSCSILSLKQLKPEYNLECAKPPCGSCRQNCLTFQFNCLSEQEPLGTWVSSVMWA